MVLQKVFCGDKRVTKTVSNFLARDLARVDIKAMAQVRIVAKCLAPALVSQCEDMR